MPGVSSAQTFARPFQPVASMRSSDGRNHPWPMSLQCRCAATVSSNFVIYNRTMLVNLTRYFLASCLVLAARPQNDAPQNEDARKLVTLRDFSVLGSRLSPASVVRLAGLHTGKQVNFLSLHEALQKVTLSGLIENIDFEYENYADKPEEVKLIMKCRDAQPVVPARLAIEGVDEEAVWNWLRDLDPLFTREPMVSRTFRRSRWSGEKPKARRDGSNESFSNELSCVMGRRSQRVRSSRAGTHAC